MLLPSFLALGLLLQGTAAAPTPHSRRSASRFALKDAAAKSAASPLVASTNVLSLKSVSGKAASSSALQLAKRASRTSTTPLSPVQSGASYAIDIDFGGQSFVVIFDTGSSDLWLAEQGVKCVDENFNPVSTAECAFGPLAGTTFQGGAIADENFNITYGDGEFLTGTLGYENVGIANITVDNQEVALVNEAYWEGDNVTSGLIGFAYPSLTDAYAGTNPAVDNQNASMVYTNWPFKAIDQGLMAPMFSLAIERGANGGGGQLALGGLPSISFNQTFASAPLQIIELIPDTITATNYSFYTIIPDGFLLQGEEETWYGYRDVNESPSTDFPVIVDSGTTLAYLPVQVAEAVANLFDPPAVYIEEEGVYEAYCDATTPTFAVRIGGQDFYINGADLLITGEEGYDPNTGGCLLGVQPADPPYILGDTFLKNVVAVFDIGASEMRFAPHENY